MIIYYLQEVANIIILKIIATVIIIVNYIACELRVNFAFKIGSRGGTNVLIIIAVLIRRVVLASMNTIVFESVVIKRENKWLKINTVITHIRTC